MTLSVRFDAVLPPNSSIRNLFYEGGGSLLNAQRFGPPGCNVQANNIEQKREEYSTIVLVN
jgi:hypothetical protein